MKPPKITVNGVQLDRVSTPQVQERPSRSRSFLCKPRNALREDGEQLLLTMHALTAAQLYFDGVLPQGRSQPVELQIGRRKASAWRILTMETRENQWHELVVVFRLERA